MFKSLLYVLYKPYVQGIDFVNVMLNRKITIGRKEDSNNTTINIAYQLHILRSH